MNYAEIKKTDIANGDGVRVSLFVSGCRRHCKGCFNAQAWDFNYGQPYTKETENEIITALTPDYISGLTLLGGDPMEPENQVALLPLLKRVRCEHPNKTIWCYTGYEYKDGAFIQSEIYTEYTKEMLSLIDILVDGPFIQEQKDIRLKFRGSRNQRILDLQRTLKEQRIITYLP